MNEARQYDHASCPDDEGLSADPLNDLLEMPDVGGSDLKQRIRFAGNRTGIDNLGMLGHGGGDIAW